jgi:hypothetical protein
MKSGIAAAVDEMARARVHTLERRQPRERISRAISVIDVVLDSLERLNLDGRSRLPEGVDAQIGVVLTLIPAEIRPAPGPREPIKALMADLYRAQESLLATRSGPEWDELRESEQELLPSA